MKAKTQIVVIVKDPEATYDFSDVKNTVEFGVDKRILDLVQHEHYFSLSPAKFYRDAITSLVSCHLSELEHEKEKSLMQKFGLTLDDLCI